MMQSKEIQSLIALFEANRNDVNAVSMKKYMKDRYSYFGLKSPLRKELQKDYVNIFRNESLDIIMDNVAMLWDLPEREFQYVAIDLLRKIERKYTAPIVPFIAQLIISKSWWDTVDGLAVNAVGKTLFKFPNEIEFWNQKWITSENLWLNRTALLFQLKYKDKTNEHLLFSNILKHNTVKEFFIRKAIGWALREYSKTNASSVISFIETNQLEPLSVREGLKWLKTNGKI